jgi:DNA repair protein RecO (recombination protein O)
MSTPRDYQTEAIIIKKVRLGEADRILTLYTPRLGKIQGVAKSVRKSKSKLAGHLELLTHSQVSLARGRNLDTITGSQTINSFVPLKTDLWLSACALYAIEMVDQFAQENQENEPLFRLLLDTLKRLAEEHDTSHVLRYFEMQLLSQTGYRPQLDECVTCHAALTPVSNYFSPGAGGILCSSCRFNQNLTYCAVAVDVLKVLRFLQHQDFENVIRLKLDGDISREVEQVLRRYIRYILEREIKSATWLDRLKEELRGKR